MENEMSGPQLVCTACEKKKPLRLSEMGCYLCRSCENQLLAEGILGTVKKPGARPDTNIEPLPAGEQKEQEG